MFMFTKFILLTLLTLKSVQGAPVNMTVVVSMIEAALDKVHAESVPVLSNLGETGSVSDVIPTPSATALNNAEFTVLPPIGGVAFTPAQNGASSAVANSASTSAVAFPSSSAPLSASASRNSTASSATSSVSASASSASAISGAPSASGLPSLSVGPSVAKSSSSSSADFNGGISLKTVTPLARGLLTVAVGIVFGAWCL